MGWLDQHSGSVTAIATAVLAIITAVYVGLTRSLARASQHAIVEAQHANQLARDANELTRQTIDLETGYRLRQQASKIIAWALPGYQAHEGNTYALVEIANKSDEPAWDCALTVLIREAQYLANPMPLIEPGAERTYQVSIAAPPPEGERAELDFKFTDNAGVRWHRPRTGALSRVTDERTP